MNSSVNDAFIDALARRAERYQGVARRVLDARLAVLRSQRNQTNQSSQEAVSSSARSGQLFSRGPLGQLADGLVARHQLNEAPETATGQTASESAPQWSSERELGTLRQFRGAWARLSAEQRLRQALAQVPAQAGPLNSNHLVHRALVTMQEISPAYLQRFVNYVDTLLWLDQQQEAAVTHSAKQEKRRGISKVRK